MEGITSPPVSQNTSFLTPLLLSMLGIVATSSAIIVYHFILVRYCMRRQQQTNAPAQAPISIGVDKKVLDGIPIHPFSAVKRWSGQEECVVCLAEVEDQEMVRVLPACRHAFHIPCVDQWLLAHTSCPLCRAPISSQENSHESPGNGSDRARSSFRMVRSFVGIRHCSSLDLPRRQRKLMPLERCLSMDRPNLEVIDVRSLNDSINLSSTSSSSCRRGKLKRSESCRTRSMHQMERVSSTLLGSFSRLRSAKGSRSMAPILPY